MHTFFKVSVAGSTPQTIVFKLDTDRCPKTCENFMTICKSNAIAKRPSANITPLNHEIQPTYRNTEFHRIIPGFMAQGGDFTSFDGKGGFAAPTTNEGKPTFPDENFAISHNREGILSMANRGKNTNGSQFFITLGNAQHLDGKHVAFGSVVRGIECVRQIGQVETDGNDRPVAMQRVVITDCGVGTGEDGVDDSNSDSCSSESSSASSRKKKKKRRRSEKKKKKRKRSHSSHRKRNKYDDSDDDSDSSRRHKKKSKEHSSRRHRKRDPESSKKRRKKDDDRHHKKRRH